MCAASGSMTAQRSRVAGVTTMGPWKPRLASSGSRPTWSMWAWLTTIPSIRRGSNGTAVLSSADSFRLPWKSPASSSVRAPAASSRCIDPVTRPAAPQKVRRISLTSSPVRVRSAGPEEAVARVAEAGKDVALVVQLAVERGGEDGDVGVHLEHAGDALGRGHDAEEADAARAGLPERADRGDRRAAGGEHRVEDEEVALDLVAGDLEVVVYRLERSVVAVEPDVPDPRRGDELGHALHHAQPRPED